MSRPLDQIEEAMASALVRALPSALDQLVELGGPRAYSVEQVAERLNIGESTVRRLIQSGRLAVVPNLSPQRIAASTLQRFLSNVNGKKAS